MIALIHSIIYLCFSNSFGQPAYEAVYKNPTTVNYGITIHYDLLQELTSDYQVHSIFTGFWLKYKYFSAKVSLQSIIEYDRGFSFLSGKESGFRFRSIELKLGANTKLKKNRIWYFYSLFGFNFTPGKNLKLSPNTESNIIGDRIFDWGVAIYYIKRKKWASLLQDINVGMTFYKDENINFCVDLLLLYSSRNNGKIKYGISLSSLLLIYIYDTNESNIQQAEFIQKVFLTPYLGPTIWFRNIIGLALQFQIFRRSRQIVPDMDFLNSGEFKFRVRFYWGW